MASFVVPVVGEVFSQAGLERKVVEVLRDRVSGAVMQVGWQRPGNDWKTFYSSICRWKVWAGQAVLGLVPASPAVSVKAGHPRCCSACSAPARIVNVGSFWQVLCSKYSHAEVGACHQVAPIRSSKKAAISIWNQDV